MERTTDFVPIGVESSVAENVDIVNIGQKSSEIWLPTTEDLEDILQKNLDFDRTAFLICVIKVNLSTKAH